MNGEGGPLPYWRSLSELADTPEFRKMVENEFPSRLPAFVSPTTRRQFLKVMGASMALLGLTGCRWPKEEIVPFAHRPEGMDPGVPWYYASAMEIDGYGAPVLVTSYDGRPIKVDGNPDHPMSKGGSDVFVQASVLSLYDPDRSRHPLQRTDGRLSLSTMGDFEAFAKKHFASLRATGGRGLAVIAESTSSLTLLDMKSRFHKAFPKAGWCSFDAFPDVNSIAGIVRATGRRLAPRADLSKAEVIVSLEDDFLSTPPAGIRATRDFARRRKALDGTMNRLYVAESTMTVTGGAADHRVAVRSDRVAALAAALRDPGIDTSLTPREREFVRQAREDLDANRGKGVVTAGPAQPPLVHALVAALNELFENTGKTVGYVELPPPDGDVSGFVRAMRDGAVHTVLVLGGNPVLSAPADLGFADALAKVPTSIRLSLYEDETSERCTWHVNAAHWLESWADVRSVDGRPMVVQPLIEPLYGGKTTAEVLALVNGDATTAGYDLVRRTMDVAKRGEHAWRKILNDGFVDEAAPLSYPKVRPQRLRLPAASAKGFEIRFLPDRKIHDGRFANNGWLQELPDQVTKLTWDNAALLNAGDADRLGVDDGDHVRITLGRRSVKIPAIVSPGQAQGSIALFAGYGRARGGRVAAGSGTDVYPLRSRSTLFVASGASVEKVPGHTDLARTQDHHAIEAFAKKAIDERSHLLIREGTLAEYRKNPEFAREVEPTPELVQLWQSPVAYDGYKWGMSIDLAACTGCSACVVACQSENNVPVVGRDEVRYGREMQWIRVDRYYSGSKEEPGVRHQPIPCMQCENAPCEEVCPVAATQHSREGLNDMVYNRCIGTRYCSNNCPYKVRRFNWFLNNKNLTDIQKMVMNPEVTVRSRGVMEKCTYCVQRIDHARIHARNENRRIKDGEIVPACAQACPAEAIVFGDLNDPKSRVRRLHDSARDYSLLDELNVRPRTRYLARLTNPKEKE